MTERTGCRGLSQFFLDVIDELVEGLEGEVALLEGGPGICVGSLFGVAGRLHLLAEAVMVVHAAAHQHDQKDDQSGNRRRDAGPPPRPLPGPFPERGRASQDRLPLLKSLEILGQSQRGGITTTRVLFQAFQADRLQIARKITLELPGESGSWLETCSSVESGVVPLNGGRPVSIS